MLTVVGGIGSVAGALMGGVLAGTAFTVLNSTFTNLATDHGGGGPWTFLANLSLVAPALVGVSLGRNPSGAVPQIVDNYRPLWRVKSVLALGVAAEVVLYLLALTKVIGNWWFVFGTAAVALVVPGIGRLVRPQAFRADAVVSPRVREPHAVAAPVGVDSALAAVEGTADARA
jgi:hypothetical protein